MRLLMSGGLNLGAGVLIVTVARASPESVAPSFTLKLKE